ncbi:uncharacterized protein LY79DRAFT_172591 [Colletotrichum navitas]|uniref:Uncharacterized protein n=1 Tax=Colletotrichum navitas TaxID=681940 RepID=A0AAD8Q106_9PEZI|nr:uncharacterized protein LY79DRAFT_172591 [Colletotrichum navitas]KAK1593872.1 hypothetical protein LY79DRAFT_172591 [Colletotrichum navitas]
MLSDDLQRCAGEDEGERQKIEHGVGTWASTIPIFVRVYDLGQSGHHYCSISRPNALTESKSVCRFSLGHQTSGPGQGMSAGTRVEKTTCGAFASGATRANPASVVSARDADTSRAPCRSITARIKSTWLRELCYQPNKPGWKKTCMNYPEGRLFSFNETVHVKFSRHKFCHGNRPVMSEKGRGMGARGREQPEPKV